MTRLLHCRTCKQPVWVTWLDIAGKDLTHHIDPHQYQCGQCMKPVETPELPLEGHRVETTSYNPDQAEIGF